MLQPTSVVLAPAQNTEHFSVGGVKANGRDLPTGRSTPLNKSFKHCISRRLYLYNLIIKAFHLPVDLRAMTVDELPVLKNLFQLYLYDMSKYVSFSPSDTGKFEYDESILSAYFEQPGHFPYFIRFDGERAGFALVRDYPDDRTLKDMGQFFVLGQYGRRGIGLKALKLCLRSHPGDWQIRILPQNTAAQKFWRKSIDKVTFGKNQVLHSDYQGKEMTFIRFSSPA